MTKFRNLEMVNPENPLMDKTQISRFVEIRNNLENELKYHMGGLKLNGGIWIEKIGYAYLKDPIRVKVEDLMLSDKKNIKCFLTRQILNPNDTCIAFFLKTKKDGFVFKGAIKDEKYLPLVLQLGSFVEAAEVFNPHKIVLSNADKKKIEAVKKSILQQKIKLKILTETKFCLTCGKPFNHECGDLVELSKKRRCNACLEVKADLSGKTRFCRTCGILFTPISRHDIFCEKHAIR